MWRPLDTCVPNLLKKARAVFSSLTFLSSKIASSESLTSVRGMRKDRTVREEKGQDNKNAEPIRNFSVSRVSVDFATCTLTWHHDVFRDLCRLSFLIVEG